MLAAVYRLLVCLFGIGLLGFRYEEVISSEMNQDHLIKLIGSSGSPYTRKMIALLRYRRIPYSVIWGDPRTYLKELGIDPPKPVLLPVCLLQEGKNIKAVCDSTPIIRSLESEFQTRSVIPHDPVLAFINYLLEDFADEWIPKYMFHYRWHFDDDIENAEKILPLWHQINLNDELRQNFGKQISAIQINRLWVVGSNEQTASMIESSYIRFLSILESHLSDYKYLFGSRPSSADFAFYGQLTQLTKVDPTPRTLAEQHSSRTIAWVDIIEDLSGLEPHKEDWLGIENAPSLLKELLCEVGKTYVPAMLANARAIRAGEDTWTTEIDKTDWTQKTFSYQAKCLKWLQEEFQNLDQESQFKVLECLHGTGCDELID